MTDVPTPPRDGESAGDPRDGVPHDGAGARPDEDVTPEQARDLAALFDDLLADEPAGTVTPESVLEEARRSKAASDRPEHADRPAAPPTTLTPRRGGGRTARRVRGGLLAAAVAAVVVTGTVLAIRSGQGDSQTAAPSSAAAATTAAASSSAASGSSAAESSSGASSSGGATASSASQAPASSATASMSGSSAGSSSMSSSLATTTSRAPGTCELSTRDLTTLRTALRGTTTLTTATAGVCRDPATIPANGRTLAVTVRTATAASCTRLRPACRPAGGSGSAWTSSTTSGVRIWVYGGGYELVVVSPSRLAADRIDAIVSDARRVIAALA